MDILKELVTIAEKEYRILRSMERELEKHDNNQDMINYLKLEKRIDKQYDKFWNYIEEITKCLSSIRNLYSWY